MCICSSMELEVSRPRTERGAVGGGAAICAFVASMELEVSRPRTERGQLWGGGCCHVCICSQYGTRGADKEEEGV